MDARLQRRIQRYGWDLAARDYEQLWQAQLAVAHEQLLALASLAPGERVLDVACGTGLVTIEAARNVGMHGRVHGVDLSGQMIDVARRGAAETGLTNTTFERMDAESLNLPDASFDVVLCALGLMYMPDPEQAVRAMRRVLRPGGRLVMSVWGDRRQCGWSVLFPIVDAEVRSEVCPLFFRLGQQDTLAAMCITEKFDQVAQRRVPTWLAYADADEACDAAFVGGPVAMAWARFDAVTRTRVRDRYVDAIDAWRHGNGYRMPGEFVIVTAVAPA